MIAFKKKIQIKKLNFTTFCKFDLSIKKIIVQYFKVVFAFDKLIVNGTYDLKGQFGWWALDSVGEQV